MKTTKINKLLICILSSVLIAAILGIFLIGSNLRYNQVSAITNTPKHTNYVSGLLSNGTGGSDFVVYDTSTWNTNKVIKLPDVSPDNYGAISNDGKYIAYTKWNKFGSVRYLVVQSVSDGKVKSYYENMPARNEIIKISWLRDNNTLLFIKHDASGYSYQEIHTLNIKTGKDNTLVKGEAWQVCTIEDKGKTASNFYLKGHNSYLKVKEKKPFEYYSKNKTSNPQYEKNYYLTQNDINNIYHEYGGSGSFSIDKVDFVLYIDFGPPRCSKDGTQIIYSATLTRTSATGVNTPLWISSAIWKYNLKTHHTSIIYKQNDGGMVGRTEWINDSTISFVACYSSNGGKDSINSFNLSNNKHMVLFPYTDKNYNNVTLLPIGDNKITFTSSKKNDAFEHSNTILFNIKSNSYKIINIKYKNKPILLNNFVFVGDTDKSFPAACRQQ